MDDRDATKDANTDNTMAVTESGSAGVSGASSISCVFLDHQASLKKSRRKRTRSARFSGDLLSICVHADNLCSAQDQAVLELAYQQNSKPDKGERAAIVTQVDLNEKEVQVRVACPSCACP